MVSWTAAAEIALGGGGASSAGYASGPYAINSAGLQAKLASQLALGLRRLSSTQRRH